MRLVSWNVNGLRAVLKKGFEDIVAQFDADIFALQETKLQAGQVDMQLPGYHTFWSYAEKKGYSGTAVFSKVAPMQVLHGLGSPHLDTEGRIVALEFPQFWFVDVYTPNAQNELARIDHRMEWDDAFREFCKGLEAGVLPASVPVERLVEAGCAKADGAMCAEGESGAEDAACADGAGDAGLGDAEGATGAIRATGVEAATCAKGAGAEAYANASALYVHDVTQPGELTQPKPVVMCGDFNVAHEEIDLKNPGPNRGNAGFSDEERGKFTNLLASGFTDTFREMHPDTTGAYSWWSYRFKARQTNAGWRIDYFLVSDALMPRVQSASIYNEVFGSDHCPVGLELDLQGINLHELQ